MYFNNDYLGQKSIHIVLYINLSVSEICLEFIHLLFVAITLSDHNLNDYKCILIYIDI
jgi:hypothetical protein